MTTLLQITIYHIFNSKNFSSLMKKFQLNFSTMSETVTIMILTEVFFLFVNSLLISNKLLQLIDDFLFVEEKVIQVEIPTR